MKNAIIFLAGAVVAAVPTYILTKKKEEARANAEIEEMRYIYKEKERILNEHIKHLEEQIPKKEEELELNPDEVEMDETEESEPKYNPAWAKPDLEEVQKIIERHKYTGDNKPQIYKSEEETGGLKNVPNIYMISMDEFDKLDGGYTKETLNYYEEDDVLANDADEVEDFNTTCGRECLDHFGEEEDDVVYVRNEAYGVDYEVICVHSSYARIVGMVSD